MSKCRDAIARIGNLNANRDSSAAKARTKTFSEKRPVTTINLYRIVRHFYLPRFGGTILIASVLLALRPGNHPEPIMIKVRFNHYTIHYPQVNQVVNFSSGAKRFAEGSWKIYYPGQYL